MYPATYRRLLPHWARRLATGLVGVVLMYAPFAFLGRAVLWISGQERLADAHSLCLRMPIQWLGQPWMYATIFSNPAYLFSVAFLPLTALLFGPLFCGWLCPAGHMTEFISRAVPPRYQIDLSGKINPVPVRYGFMLGMMGVALAGGNACCSFCNFTHAQNIVSAISGDTLGISYMASFSIVSFAIWFVLMGLFTKGGRGWCNLLCPAGALMGLAHKVGVTLGISRHMAIDEKACTQCGACVTHCAAWAVTRRPDAAPAINAAACTACGDCAQACPSHAVRYVAPRKPLRSVVPSGAMPGDAVPMTASERP